MMKQRKRMTKYRLTALTLALIFSNIAMAVELSNENKYNRSSDSIGNADTTSDVNSNFSFTVNNKANTSTKHQFTSDTQTIQQMQERRRLVQKDQLEAYKRHIQNRKQQSSANTNLPPDVQARREEYIKQMNTRRELMEKMMNERRKAAAEKRQVMLQKMHQTSTTSVTTGKT